MKEEYNFNEINNEKNQNNENIKEKEEWICPICMEEFREPSVTKCGHVFCRRCISEWLLRSDVCPTCNRKHVKASELIYIKGQGQSEDRPEPDNTLKANNWSKSLARFFKVKIYQRNFQFRILSFILIYICFFMK